MLSIRYERQLDMDMATINPYGAYLYSLPGLIRKILSLKVLKKIILKNEVKLLRNYERNISQIYDKTVFVAEREANLLNKELNFNKAIAIPLGVDVEYFGEYFKKIESEANTISFLGAMSVAHNEAGAIHFMKDIFPLVQKEIPDAKFIVVGGGITELLKQSAKGNNRIVFTGRVDDVRTNIGKTRCFVCPLTFGSGIKTKNLEAMAMGVPVVTTSIGAENIYAKDGTDWLVADSNKKFADAIISILKDDKLHENLQLNAYNFVNENFTWSVAENKMRELFGK
jgi:glycosyltransferase involved in cell wall biosynthesis